MQRGFFAQHQELLEKGAAAAAPAGGGGCRCGAVGLCVCGSGGVEWIVWGFKKLHAFGLFFSV